MKAYEHEFDPPFLGDIRPTIDLPAGFELDALTDFEIFNGSEWVQPEILLMVEKTFTLREKLEQLRDSQVGGPVPAFFQDQFNYVADLQQLAKEALAELTRLEEYEWMYKDLCK